jgi:hypothetical protein
MSDEPEVKPMRSTLESMLSHEVKAWAHLGLPALLQRFVLKHGSVFTGSKRPKGIKRRTQKQCFRNSCAMLLNHPRQYQYYEGYAMSTRIAFPFLHAWNVRDGQVVDVTLKNPEEYEYMGVNFTERQVWQEQIKTGVYGLLETGFINVELLREIDNDLVEEALAIKILHSGRAEAAGTGDADGLGEVAGGSGSEANRPADPPV